jgi:hypothetical protein
LRQRWHLDVHFFFFVDDKEVKRMLKLLYHLAVEPGVLFRKMCSLVVIHALLDQQHLVVG